MIRNQKGFTAFEIVIVIVALLAIGAAGYFAYQARQDKTDYSVSVSKKKTATVSNSTSKNYLVIGELGIKLPGNSDLFYVAGDHYITSFGSKELQSKSSGCGAGAIGEVVRIDKNQLSSDPDSRWTQRLDGLRDAVNQGVAKEFDTFFIYEDGPQAACSDTLNESINKLQAEKIQVLRNAVAKAEKN